MKRIPWTLQDALVTDVDGYVLQLYPLTKRVFVVEPDFKYRFHRIDFYDGLRPRAVYGNENRTLDFVRAIGAILEPAMQIAVDHMWAAWHALDASDRIERPHDQCEPLARAGDWMERYADALRALVPWHVFQTELAARQARTRRSREIAKGAAR